MGPLLFLGSSLRDHRRAGLAWRELCRDPQPRWWGPALALLDLRQPESPALGGIKGGTARTLGITCNSKNQHPCGTHGCSARSLSVQGCYWISVTSNEVLLSLHMCSKSYAVSQHVLYDPHHFAQRLSFIPTRRSPVLRNCFDRSWGGGGGEEEDVHMFHSPDFVAAHRHQLLPIKRNQVRLGSPLQAL